MTKKKLNKAPLKRVSIIDRDYLRANSVDVGECWEWTGQYTSGGQPWAQMADGVRRSVRRSYIEQARQPGDKPLPKDWRAVPDVCNNQRCVCPEHFHALSKSKIAKGITKKVRNERLRIDRIRAVRRAQSSKLTDEQRHEIVYGSEQIATLAPKVGLSVDHVGRLRRQGRREGTQAGPFAAMFR